MWPSKEIASLVYNVANFALIGSLVVGVIATVLIVWMGNVKEEYLTIYLNEANTRTETAKADAARAIESAAKANERAAQAEARAAEANLELAKFKAPRNLPPEQIQKIITGLRPFEGVPFDFSVQTDPEPISLMEQISNVLLSAGWKWQPVAGREVVFTIPNKPSVGIVVFTGLEIQITESRRAEWGAAVVALRDALKIAGIDVNAKAITDGTVLPDAVHIKIGKKP